MAIVYSKQTWTDDDGSGSVGTIVTKSRMDHIEDGIYAAQTILDTRANRPAAGAGYSGVTFISTDTIGVWVCDGSSWIRTNLPPGAIVPTVGRTADPGYIMCDGASYLVSNALYVDVIARLTQSGAYEYGGVFGTSFLAPEMRDRMIRGRSTLTTAIVNNSTAPAITIGVGNLPVHTHDMSHSHSTSANTGTENQLHQHDYPFGAYAVNGYNPVVSSGSSAYGVNSLSNAVNTESAAHNHDFSHTHSFSGSTGNGGFANTAITIPQPQHTTVNFQMKL